MTKNTVINLEDTYDFGFTAVDEDDIINSNTGINSLQEENVELKSRLKSVEKMILPLLQNLAKNPEKPMIKWPNRKEMIDLQIEKLINLTRI